MVFDHEGQYDSEWAAVCSVASKFGMTPETLRTWVRREMDFPAPLRRVAPYCTVRYTPVHSFWGVRN